MPEARYTDLWGEHSFSLSWEPCYTSVIVPSSFWPFQLCFLPSVLRTTLENKWVYNCIVTTGSKPEPSGELFQKIHTQSLTYRYFHSWAGLGHMILKKSPDNSDIPLWKRGVSLQLYLGFFLKNLYKHPWLTMVQLNDFLTLQWHENMHLEETVLWIANFDLFPG